MNKKILLFLVVACMISAVATFVYAGGTACGLGGCQRVSVTQVPTVTTSLVSINSTAGSFTRNTVTFAAFCGNGSTPCFNSTNAVFSNCTDTSQVYCDSKSLEYYQVRYNASNATSGAPFYNITFVQVGAGSEVAAAAGSQAGKDAFAYFELDTGSELVKKVVIPANSDISINPDSIEVINAENSNEPLIVIGITDISSGSAYPGAIVVELGGDNREFGFSSTVGLQDSPLDKMVVSLGGPTNAYLAIGFTNAAGESAAAGVKLEGNAPNYFELASNTGPLFNNPATAPVSTCEIININQIPGISYDEVDPSNPEPEYIVIGNFADPVTIDQGIFVSNYAPEAPTFHDTVQLMTRDKPNNNDEFSITSFNSEDSIIYGSENVRGDGVILTDAAAFLLHNMQNAYLSGASGRVTTRGITVTDQYTQIAACTSDRTQRYVGIVDDNGVLYVINDGTKLTTNSQEKARFTVGNTNEVTEMLFAECGSPSIIGAQINGSATGYNGTRIIVMQGSNIVSAYDIKNMTVDSAIVTALIGPGGGHSNDSMSYVLGGRPINNASGGLILNNTYIFLDYVNTSLGLDATNPNGTMRFTTDKQVAIRTMHPDMNILNFQLDFQAFNGTFDTGAGTCTNCSYDLDNLTCQAEVEKIWGMFQQYNLTMSLTTASAISMTNLTMQCRTANQTVIAHSNCAGLFSTYGVGTDGCMSWTATAGRSWLLAGGAGLGINLTGFTSANLTLGTMTPTATCEQIACQIYGVWAPGDTQNFVLNKTITVTAI